MATLYYSGTCGTLNQRRHRLGGRRGLSGDRHVLMIFMYNDPSFYIADDEAALLGDSTEADSLPISASEAAAFAEVLAEDEF